MALVERYRHHGAFVYVRRSAYDLQQILFAYVHPADSQFVGIRVLFYLYYLSDYDLLYVLAEIFDSLQIGA